MFRKYFSYFREGEGIVYVQRVNGSRVLDNYKTFLWKYSCKIPDEDKKNNITSVTNIVLFFQCLARERMLGNAVSCAVFQPPSWSHKNRTWDWNTSSPRDKESTQPVPSSLLCVGISSLVANSGVLLCSA